VPMEPSRSDPFEPTNPERFSKDIAARVNELMSDPSRRIAFGAAGRRRVESMFGWPAIAAQTEALYRTLV